MILVIFTSFNLSAISENRTNVSDTVKHRIDIRVNHDNLVVFRADCIKNQKWINYDLKVYSENGKIVYDQTFNQKGGVYRGFDMKELPQGNYDFVVYENRQLIYSKGFSKTPKAILPNETSNKILVEETK